MKRLKKSNEKSSMTASKVSLSLGRKNVHSRSELARGKNEESAARESHGEERVDMRLSMKDEKITHVKNAIKNLVVNKIYSTIKKGYTKVAKILNVTSARKNLRKNQLCLSTKRRCTKIVKILHATSANKNLDRNHICTNTKRQSMKVAKILNVTSARKNLRKNQLCLSTKTRCMKVAKIGLEKMDLIRHQKTVHENCKDYACNKLISIRVFRDFNACELISQKWNR
uniref:C2H2-type domain-containing protein n=1 Tax=Trichogramma kaykai TaxID=54128 RepID=A0ABD2WGQ8_9HYME